MDIFSTLLTDLSTRTINKMMGIVLRMKLVVLAMLIALAILIAIV